NLDNLHETFPNIEAIPGAAIAHALILKREMGVIKDLINETDRSGIPVSPIDHIRNKIEAAGYKFGEISGRGESLGKNGKLAKRPRGETTQAGKNKILGDFNRTQGSALFLTASGTTGISAHSSTKFRNQAQRQMIVAQFLPDVNDQIQLYGRVLRKGQRVNPEYVNLASTIPAENRLLSILGSKLKSLNANVTSASEGVTTGAAGGVDFMNQYGDEIAWNYFHAHPEVVAEMRHTFKDGQLEDLESIQNSETRAPGDFVRKASGEIAILPYAEQEDFYNHLLSEYSAHIAFLDEIGENMLKAQNLKLDAETVSSQAIFQGAGDSVFDGPAQLEKLKVTSSKRPIPATDIPAVAEKNTEKVDAEYKDFTEKARDAAESHLAALKEKQGAKDNYEEIRAAHETRLLDAQNQISRAFSLFNKPVLYTNAEGTVLGFVTDVRFDPTKPVTPSAHKVTVYVNTEQQHVTIPVSQLSKVEQFRGPDWMGNYTRLANIATNKSVVTGNLIGGYGAINSLGGEGRVITYTTKDGEVKTGIMMPRKFNPATSIKPVTTGKDFVAMLRKSLPISTPGGAEFHWTHGEISVRVPSSKLRGGKYWQDQRLLSLVAGGEMRQVGGNMVGNVAEHNADALVNFFNKDISDPITSFEAPKPTPPGEEGGPLGTPVDAVAKVAWNTAINSAALAAKAGRRT
ncbi:MAG TPA: strawberry notch C-terminal domain-containing protein, partial [Planctomycetaceae bacterium]|nr:strawberry notch C-terminal domain-containing protein [Planctomycetaceae bacterium]